MGGVEPCDPTEGIADLVRVLAVHLGAIAPVDMDVHEAGRDGPPAEIDDHRSRHRPRSPHHRRTSPRRSQRGHGPEPGVDGDVTRLEHPVGADDPVSAQDPWPSCRDGGAHSPDALIPRTLSQPALT